MKLSYNMDLTEESAGISNTPGLSAQRLPFFTSGAGHFVANRSYFTEREGMEGSYLLLYTIAGCGHLKYRNCEYELLPGQAVLIDCFEYQYYCTAAEAPWEFKWVHIGGMAAGEYEERINSGSLSIIRLDDACRTGAALDTIRRILSDKSDFLPDVKICSGIMEILTELVTARQSPSTSGSLHRADMESALEYIRANYSRKISIDDIIGSMHVSKFYFLRLFKEYTGLGLYEYLNNHRINMAKEMLKNASLTVGCIAVSVGFDDVNCFIRYFKKVTGTTPAIFRKYYLY